MKSAHIELRAIAAEALGTGFLVAGVIGSGIMASYLTNDGALALLCNTLATAALLVVLIMLFAPISGAHFNPAVTMALAMNGVVPVSQIAPYIAAQLVGGVCGTLATHLMFGMKIFAYGMTIRTGANQWLAESIATFGLVLTILGCARRDASSVASAVGLYIGAAYWFTASTSFANPAVTLARALTPTYAGIRPQDAPFFMAAQIVGAVAAALLGRKLFDSLQASAAK
ncbi:MAG TPA: MIP/aquaporin family protein [Rhizomicrobium sp.]|jgi:glycerol uptake facilitator-like aquaporin|nr:MIP/aquaporin family protein [Rhizomicrobium sp.]